ncbi:CHC2 zinc finger domain-containing protein [Cerasicoccus maritimus]|uniref:CHC2 zinc finger domain-containing protein n=1 Tax=Cerasicoccus maritimus TaxID=490089 RepID=UPI0028529EF5|nr:CHC2 zinc finger domain-containing protein [Cerasicoccus maritimus]
MANYYSREQLDALKGRVDLAAYVQHSGIAELKRVGARYRGHCPLHDDGTPSFYVDSTHSGYYCFGCQAKGDVFALTQEHFGLSFNEAVERVRAFACGHPIESMPPKPVEPDLPQPLTLADTLALEQAAAYYQRQLSNSEIVQDYLASRKIMPSAIEDFDLGYGIGFLAKALPKNAKRLTQLGLVTQKGQDAFFGRITVPIRDASGTVRQFYGRSVKEQYKHRYLSRPHQTLFNPQALDEKTVILCESIIDALTCYGLGFENTVSIYGAHGMKTQYTEQMAQAGVKKVILAYDADKAGDTGASQAAEMLDECGVRTSRLQLPRGLDVNRLAVESSHARQALEGLVREAQR